jgi:hypothetical protein
MCQQMKYETMNEKMSRKFPHLPTNLCVKCIFNAQYQRVKCTNHEGANFSQFPLLNRKMLSL